MPLRSQVAYQRAVKLSLRGSDVASLEVLGACRFLGVACSAAVVSAEPKKGDHRAYIAAFGDGGWVNTSISITVLNRALRLRR